MIAGTRVHHADCSDPDALTAAEMEGRRQVRPCLDILREHYAGARVDAVSLPLYRHSRNRHASSLYH